MRDAGISWVVRAGRVLAALVLLAMLAPFGYAVMGGDCADEDPTAHPGAYERCDGTVDHDCDGMVDDGCACRDGDVRDCGPSDGMGGILETGECARGLQQCLGGIWTTSCTGASAAGAAGSQHRRHATAGRRVMRGGWQRAGGKATAGYE